MSLERLKRKLEKKRPPITAKTKGRFPIVTLLRGRAMELIEAKPIATLYRDRLQLQYGRVQPLTEKPKPTENHKETPRYVV